MSRANPDAALSPACMKCEQVTGKSTCFPAPCVFWHERNTPGTTAFNIAELDRVRRGMRETVRASTPAAGEVRTYREGVERACAAFEDAVSKGYPTPADKRDQCAHGSFGWQDCIACYDEALTASIAAIRKLP